MKSDKFKGDGFDQERIDAAKAKRERKAMKRSGDKGNNPPAGEPLPERLMEGVR